VGLVYDTSGGYETPFLAIAAATLIGLAILGGHTGPRRTAEPAATLMPGRGGGGGGA
jgi:hypothetical protein